MYKRWHRIVPLLTILLLLLSACGTPELPAAAPAGESSNTSSDTQQAAPAAETAGQSAELKDVPRNRTLIMAGLGGEHPGAFTDIELFNSYAPGLSRSGFTQACNEALFYYNMIGDEFIPWMGESYTYNDDFTEVVIKIRQGVEWSDGTPFTANDVAFSLNLLLEHPDLSYAGEIIDTVQSAEVVDDLNVKIALTGVNPRFVFDKLTFHADLGVPLVAEHVWKDQDPSTFTTRKKAGRSAPAPGSWSIPMCNARSGICARIGGAPRPGFMPCPRWNAWSSCLAWMKTRWSS